MFDRRGFVRAIEREPNLKKTADTFAADHGDRSAMLLNDLQRSGEADPSAGELSDHVRAPVAAFEDARYIRRWDADALIPNGDDRPGFIALVDFIEADRHRTAVWAVFHRVAEQVRQHALDADRVPFPMKAIGG